MLAATTIASRSSSEPGARPGAGKQESRQQTTACSHERKAVAGEKALRSADARGSMGLQRAEQRSAAYDAERAGQEGKAAGNAAVALRQGPGDDVGVGDDEQAVGAAMDQQKDRQQRQ